jgi:hypothetical protein
MSGGAQAAVATRALECGLHAVPQGAAAGGLRGKEDARVLL